MVTGCLGVTTSRFDAGQHPYSFPRHSLLVVMEQQVSRQQAPAQRYASHQGSAIDMMIHSLVTMVQAGRTNPAKTDGARLFFHDH
jgi:hypothetical protein